MQFVNASKVCKGMDKYGDIPPSRTLVKEVVHVAWPSVFESFFVFLVGVIDTIMVGTLGAHAIAAVGLTMQPKFIALAIFFSINMAVSAIVARRKGEENRESANRILRMCFVITLLFTVIISILTVIFASPILHMVGSQPDTHEIAVEYLQIIMGGIIFSTITLLINAAQRGAGNTRIALITNLISNAVNVVFNYLLIGGHFGFPKLGVRGAAIATILGTICACILSIMSVFHKNGFLYFRAVKGWIADRKSNKSLLNVGFSGFVEQICIRVGFLLFHLVVANLGTMEFAAHQIGMNMMGMSFSIGDGFSVAAVTLIGQSLGRNRPDLAKIYGNVCQKIGLICAFAISIVYFFFGRQIFGLFSQEPVILDYSIYIMRILSIMLFLQIEQVVQFGCLRGAGDTKYTALVSLISVTIIRPGAAWLLCYGLGFGLVGAWVGTACDQLIRFLLSYIRFKRGKWTNIKL